MLEPNLILRDAIVEGFKKAGWMQPTENVVTEIESSVNRMDARAANEAAKKERMIAEMHALLEKRPDLPPPVLADIKEAIVRAQG